MKKQVHTIGGGESKKSESRKMLEDHKSSKIELMVAFTQKGGIYMRSGSKLKGQNAPRGYALSRKQKN